jgi:hypothetical protein
MTTSPLYDLLSSSGYQIPDWCWMPLDDHLYCGGCWGITQGCVEDKGRTHCESCEYYVTAIKLLDSSHPMHKSFCEWLDGKEPTKRQAAKFLQQKRGERFAEAR